MFGGMPPERPSPPLRPTLPPGFTARERNPVIHRKSRASKAGDPKEVASEKGSGARKEVASEKAACSEG